MRISVIVTNWNGVKLLKKNLETIIVNSPEAGEIILADDCSSDNSLAFGKKLQKTYPKLRLVSRKKNLGFGQNSNDAVSKARGDLIVLLNNDISPHPKYITNAVKHFSDPNVFGIGFAELHHENWARLFWEDGYLQHEPGITDIGQTHISGWVSGGSSVIRKSLFQKLGGFDPVYKPFYSEDLDLGFRAWKSGYLLLWEPKSIVEHKHESTMSKFSLRELNYIKERNRLLSTWRNITDPNLLFQNKLALIGRVIGGPNYIKIIRAAKRQLKNSPPPIVFSKFTDRQVLAKFQP